MNISSRQKLVFISLDIELARLKAEAPEKLPGHPRLRLYTCVINVLKEIQNDPTGSQYLLGNTLGKEHRDWRRAKEGLPSR